MSPIDPHRKKTARDLLPDFTNLQQPDNSEKPAQPANQDASVWLPPNLLPPRAGPSAGSGPGPFPTPGGASPSTGPSAASTPLPPHLQPAKPTSSVGPLAAQAPGAPAWSPPAQVRVGPAPKSPSPAGKVPVKTGGQEKKVASGDFSLRVHSGEMPAEDREETPFEVAGAAIRSSPPFLVSMLVHLVMVVLLGLVSFSQATTPELKIEATYAETLGEQLLDDAIMSDPLEALDNADPAASLDQNPVASPLASLPELSVQLEGTGSGSGLEGIGLEGVAGPSIGLALSGREKGARGSLLAAYGGTATTESSVGLALDWLRRNQQRDGSWSLTGPYENGVTVENRTAATAMALIALLGNGNTPKSSPYGDAVDRGVEALLKMQDADGLFFHDGESNQRMYSQAMATIAVCELYGMTKDEKYHKPAQRALNYAAKVQADDGLGGGGWRYQPKQDVDTSVTGWFVMAFQSARMSGLEGYSPVMEKVSLYLDHVTKDGSTYQYRLDEGERISMTAEALLCRQYLGWERNDPRLVEGVRKILENPINWEEPSFYYWYYATQVLHHMGGSDWDRWNKVMREQLPKNQIKAGRERGSWSPSGDPYGYKGGRLYATCFCTFMLEVYYRHLPIYRIK